MLADNLISSSSRLPPAPQAQAAKTQASLTLEGDTDSNRQRKEQVREGIRRETEERGRIKERVI